MEQKTSNRVNIMLIFFQYIHIWWTHWYCWETWCLCPACLINLTVIHHSSPSNNFPLKSWPAQCFTSHLKEEIYSLFVQVDIIYQQGLYLFSVNAKSVLFCLNGCWDCLFWLKCFTPPDISICTLTHTHSKSDSASKVIIFKLYAFRYSCPKWGTYQTVFWILLKTVAFCCWKLYWIGWWN